MIYNFFGIQNTRELDNADLLVIKANKMMYENNDEAYLAFIQASNLFKKNNDDYQYINCLERAVNLLLKKDINKETKIIIKKLIDIYIELGRFNKLGKLYDKIASLYENIDIEETIYYLLKAIQCYDSCENHKYCSKTCKIKLVHLYIQKKNYFQSCEILNQIIESKNDSAILLNYILCILATDDFVFAKKEFEEKNMLLSTYDKILIENILQSLMEGNVDLFQSACQKYDNIIPLNKINVDILLHIKNTLFNNETDIS
jgi:tetratricopeptide (TPR) repeat protein